MTCPGGATKAARISAPELGADRDVLQVRVARREAPRGGDGLVEARVDAARLRVHVPRQRVDVRALELVELAVRRGSAFGSACLSASASRTSASVERPPLGVRLTTGSFSSSKRMLLELIARAQEKSVPGERLHSASRASGAPARRRLPERARAPGCRRAPRASPSPRARAPAASPRRASAASSPSAVEAAARSGRRATGRCPPRRRPRVASRAPRRARSKVACGPCACPRASSRRGHRARRARGGPAPSARSASRDRGGSSRRSVSKTGPASGSAARARGRPVASSLVADLRDAGVGEERREHRPHAVQESCAGQPR